MSSIVGHCLAGMGAWGLARNVPALQGFESRGWFVAAAAGSVLPDLDALIGLEHRGATHTLGFAIAAAALIAGSAAVRHRWKALWLLPVFVGIIWIHSVMDFLTGGGRPIAPFWPLWSWSSFPLEGGLPGHSYTTRWSELPGLLTRPWTMTGMLFEALIFGPLFAASLLQRTAVRFTCAIGGVLVWLVLAVIQWIPAPEVPPIGIAGRVVDAAGNPVPGATLTAPRVETDVFVDTRTRVMTIEPRNIDWFTSPCRSDQEGLFSGKVKWPGGPFPLLATTQNPDRAAIVIVDETAIKSPLAIKLSPLVTVRGNVVRPKKLRPDCEIYVYLSVIPEEVFMLSPSRSGSFSFAVPPGTYQLTACAPPDWHIVRTVHPKDDGRDVNLEVISPD